VTRGRTKRRELRRAILKRSRERRRNGRRVAWVEYDAATVDMLVKRGLLGDGITDRRAIDDALTRLIKSLD
jgi:hypothetical protein